MALKWKKKLYWWDEEDGKLYIHPILGFIIISLSLPLTWAVLDVLFEIGGH